MCIVGERDQQVCVGERCVCKGEVCVRERNQQVCVGERCEESAGVCRGEMCV